ncbi:activating transcription factor 7-interacting protein 1 isoform X3, partial [Xyrichtys novacula]
MFKNGTICWSSLPQGVAGRKAAENDIKMTPGPTRLAISHAADILSTFKLFLRPAIEKIAIEMTNVEGVRRYGQEWKTMDVTDLHAYIGLLILAGVYRSRGEAASSLWNDETGRPIFRATMSLGKFHTISAVLRFDDRETRPALRIADKLAAIRDVWDKWVQQLPLMYNPGPDVTVDERLVAVLFVSICQANLENMASSYGLLVMHAQITLGTCKFTQGSQLVELQRKKQGMRVVLEMTEGLRGHNVTCDNFFTSRELGQVLLKKRITMVGTVRRNKPELPPALTATRGREVFSSKFAFTQDTTVVSCMPKNSKNVILMSTLHKAAEVSTREDKKTAIILDYNANKGGVDNLDKVTGTYSCKRKTARWPLILFHNIIDVSTYNAFIIWSELNPSWRASKRNWRRFFLEELGKALVAPSMEKRRHLPRTEASAALVPLPVAVDRFWQVQALCVSPR